MHRMHPTSKKLLSDHMPFLIKAKDFSCIGWNILCPMRFYPKYKYFNNGFTCPNETLEQYHNRLAHIAAQLNIAAKQERPAFICLQECPESEESREIFTRALQQAALKEYVIEFYNNNSDEFYLITLYDKQRYVLENDLSEKMLALTLNEGFKDRVLPLVFSVKDTEEKILVVNVHANFAKDVKQDVKSLFHYATELGIQHIVMLGDYNRDLVSVSDDYSRQDVSQALDANKCFADKMHVRATDNASFCSKYNAATDQKGQRLETRDGAMATFPIELVCLTDINSANTALSFNKEISSHLSTIPEGFLEKLITITNAKLSEPRAS